MTQTTDVARTGSAPVGETALRRAGNGISHDEARTLIRDDIADARQRMSGTLDELAERLNPNRLKRQVQNDIRDATIGRVKTMARDTAGRVSDTRHSIFDTIRENPLPAAMAAVGIGWLVKNRSHTSERRYESYGRSTSRSHDEWAAQDRYRTAMGSGATGAFAPESSAERAYDRDELWREADGSDRGSRTEHMKERAHDAREAARERAQHAGEAVRERTSQARDMARERAQQTGERARELASTARERTMDMSRATRERALRAERRVEDSYFENPLALGAAAAALGFVAGISAPATRKESEWMGDARDNFVERAKDEFEDLKEKAQHVGSRALEETKEAAREEGMQPRT